MTTLPEFLRIFPMRAPNIMWFLGAGASVSAGLPTAGDMVWDFKRRIFCAETRKHVALCPGLNDASFRQRLDNYFSAKPSYPSPGAENEYSFYFEATYPDERERRKYIDDCISGVRVSQGYLALAALVKLAKIKVVWTTNFDRLSEDAFVKLLGSTSMFHVATLDTPNQAEQAINEGLRPVLVKIHGDFQSRHLKNTAEELREQDRQLRRCLTQEAGRRGLAVVGYSGRDNSIMAAIEEGIDLHKANAFPAGLFWFHRSGSEPFPRVSSLIERASQHGINAALVEIATFDELMQDLFTMIDDVPADIWDMLKENRRRLVLADVPPPGEHWPVIRLNAIPVLEAPSVCRRVSCAIGGTKEVRDAIQQAEAQVIGMRRKAAGVICFGSDVEVRKAFEPFHISEFDLHTIEAARLNFDSAELGLLNEAVVKAFVRERPLLASPTRDGWKVYPDMSRLKDDKLRQLNSIDGGFTGTIPNTSIQWFDALLLKLVGKLNKLWLVFEPTVWIVAPNNAVGAATVDPQGNISEIDRAIMKEFIRERSARRYNKQLNSLLDAWIGFLIGPDETADKEVTLRCFGIGDGIDAAFKLSRTTAFSRRV